MKAPPKPVIGPGVRRWYAAIGTLGGLRRSKRKAETARANGCRPCAPGKSRGRPKKEKTAPVAPVESIEFDCANPECKALIVISGEPIAILRKGKEIAVRCSKCMNKTRVPPDVLG